MEYIALPLQEAVTTLPAQGYTAQSQGSYARRLFPELGAQRGYGKNTRPVLDIFGKRYRVEVELNDPESPWQTGGELRFMETTDALTPFILVPERTADIEGLCDLYGQRWSRDEATPNPLEPAQIAQVEAYLAANNHTCFCFGQPRFVQNPVYPSHEGQAAFPLLCLETGWGDCGNINIFVAVENNRPVKAWLEAACA